MFPPSLPHVLVRWLSEAGDTVFDPFSGRGTVPLEACLLGRRGLGMDANPLAWILSSAKVNPPSRSALVKRVADLRSAFDPDPALDHPDHIRMLFQPATLAALSWLRTELDQRNQVDAFILAMLLGMLHRNADRSGNPRGLTVAMPNTFAMAPGYVRNYIDTHRLSPPTVDVFELLSRRSESVSLPTVGFTKGRAWMGDAEVLSAWPMGEVSPRLILSSPPYLEVIRYGKFNWIRLWLLGHEPKAVDQRLFASSSTDKYLAFMSNVLQHSAASIRRDGHICFVIGDVRRRDKELNLAKLVSERCVPDGLEVVDVIADRVPVEHKVSRIWKENRGRATRTDRLLLLRAPDAVLPALGRMNWSV